MESIGWRSTQVRTLDKRPSYIPNAVFSSIIVVNSSRMTNWRIETRIPIRYEDAPRIEGITQHIQDMLGNHPDVDQNQDFLVYFSKFEEYSLDIVLDFFTKTTCRLAHYRVRENILLQAVQIVEQHGAALALPARQVYGNPSSSTGSETKTDPPTVSSVQVN